MNMTKTALLAGLMVLAVLAVSAPSVAQPITACVDPSATCGPRHAWVAVDTPWGCVDTVIQTYGPLRLTAQVFFSPFPGIRCVQGT